MAIIYRLLFVVIFSLFFLVGKSQDRDTIITAVIVYNGDTLPYKLLETVSVYGRLTPEQKRFRDSYNRLRNAVYVTYPYAVKAGAILNEMNDKLETITSKSERKKYIKSREKDLKREFEKPLTNLSVYQGKVLMKLINRETGNNCYEIIKEYKGGVTARVYQTVAFFFNSSLKQSYDAFNDDKVIESLVKEVQRMYGYKDSRRIARNLSISTM
ncbi:MAG: DUF4294 domain-containing protein [Bacteroidetes bacterium]|nr:DUF4294 domain-containing protein [Bacteroidota bacterium]